VNVGANDWDIEFANRQRAAYEKAKAELRWLVEQEQLRAGKVTPVIQAEAIPAEVKNEKPSPPQSTESGGPKTKLIRAAATAIWGPDGPPKNLPPQVIFQKVGGYVEKQHSVSVGKSQVLRALGLKSE
jgi:hypothetical protein